MGGGGVDKQLHFAHERVTPCAETAVGAIGGQRGGKDAHARIDERPDEGFEVFGGIVFEAVEGVIEERFDSFEEDDRAGVVERGAGGKVTVEGGDAHVGVRRDALEGDFGVRASTYLGQRSGDDLVAFRAGVCTHC